jgi:nucleoside-diphosphate-sugar epimerase
MNVLVTGCAGFIGSNIADRLVNSKGFTVYGVDNFLTGLPENIQHLDKKMSFIRGDLRDHKTADRVTRGIDIVCHQAALPSVPRSVDDPITSNDHNVNATLSLLNACVANGVKKIVYASSSSVYGDNKIMPRREDLLPMPKSPYAVSKLTGEYYLRSFSSTYGLDAVTLRYFNVFGARQNPKSQYAAVIPRFIVSTLKDEPIKIYGNGKQTRDFSYIDNVVNANVLAILSDREFSGDVMNIACGKKYSLLKMVDILEELSGKDINIEFDKPRIGDVMHSHANIKKAKRLINYSPEVDFYDGMKRTFKYYKGWLDGKRT